MKQIICWVAPHPDDEVLTMGADVLKHVRTGNYVHHVLLATLGIGSGAQALTPLSRPQFALARLDEARRACAQLGIAPDNVMVSPLSVPDGALTVQAGEDVLAEYLERYPTAWIKTLSNRPAPGRHEDHVNLGQAAVNVAPLDLRLYVEPYTLSAFKTANPTVVVTAAQRPATNDVQYALRAAAEYTDVDHERNRYGIGGLSVKSFFQQFVADPASYYHVP